MAFTGCQRTQGLQTRGASQTFNTSMTRVFHTSLVLCVWLQVLSAGGRQACAPSSVPSSMPAGGRCVDRQGTHIGSTPLAFIAYMSAWLGAAARFWTQQVEVRTAASVPATAACASHRLSTISTSHGCNWEWIRPELWRHVFQCLSSLLAAAVPRYLLTQPLVVSCS
jgi:hypothetical protein